VLGVGCKVKTVQALIVAHLLQSEVRLHGAPFRRGAEGLVTSSNRMNSLISFRKSPTPPNRQLSVN